ncbi:sugar ABC transporter substrate-binding protein [Pseudactinotalea sp. Z1748]|uniref:sugar ABC transporter substrate-binding protein n=1 Tax=Pseudactinotalea sp. Z1748 TaxID=3413027 RepID=UPI003C7E3E2E
MKTRTRRRTGWTVISAVAALGLALAGCTAENADDGGSDGGSGTTTEGEETVETSDGDLTEIEVALIPGGAHPYFQPWQDGAEAAVAEFGVGGYTFNETGEWDQTKQNAAIDSLAAQGYEAFAIFGVSPTDINSTFSSLKGQGFSVAAVASCPAGDENEADYCLSTDTGEAAYLAAVATIDAMGGEGNLVHLTGNAVDSNTQRRIEGVERAVEETDGAVTLIQTVTDVDEDLQTAQRAVDDLLASRGAEITGIVTTAYNPAVAATQGVGSSDLDITVVGIDDDETILTAIQNGSITGTVVQNPWGQAYISTWALASLQAGVCTVNDPGFVVDSGSFLVTQENLDTYDDERMTRTEELLTAFQTEYLNCE